ncbi:MAG: cytochrome c-type biogenesis CcmF C-terminal domain-containing protein, partial [Rubrivivax sp.]
YYELGWGGWWFWDPVENASFMPWLAGTALIHSLAVTEKRGGFRMWTVLLAIVAFSLSLLGTFLVRSGVLSSVHAFATDPARGIFILGFLSVVVGGSLALFAWRGPSVGVGGLFEPVSREAALLANNVLLMVACAAVLLGTLYPLVVDALGLGKISVGPAYFNAVFVPLMAPAMFLIAVGPLARWKQASLGELALKLRWLGLGCLLLALALPAVLGRFSPMVAFGLFLALWVAGSTLLTLLGRVRGQPRSLWGARLRAMTGSWYGMLLAHLGVAVFIVGVTLVGGYESEQDLRMDIGSTAHAGGYDFTLVGLRDVQGPNYSAVQATMTVSRNGRVVRTLYPEKRLYTVTRTPMSEVAIERGVTRDLYVSMGEPLDDGRAWSVRLYVKPFVNWIWGGCVLMALGGLLAVADRRYRLASRRHAGAGLAGDTIGASAA